MAGTVLIVEDAESCATTLEIAFHSIPGISIAVAGSARDAMRVLNGEGIRALVTDLHIGAADGLELIRQVRGEDRYAKLPIIVVSGDTDPRTPERVARFGADAYFAKPYSPAEVRQKLEELLDANDNAEFTL